MYRAAWESEEICAWKIRACDVGYGLHWRVIETAFESCILTGAVINSKHIELCRFLEDASEIVLEHVHSVQRYDSIKINTVNGSWRMINAQTKISLLGTMNYINTRICASVAVIEPILSPLEEFQERDGRWVLSRI